MTSCKRLISTSCLTEFPWNPLKELLKSCLCKFNNFPGLKSLTDISSSGHALKNFMWQELTHELGKPSINPFQQTTKTKFTLILHRYSLKYSQTGHLGPLGTTQKHHGDR